MLGHLILILTLLLSVASAVAVELPQVESVRPGQTERRAPNGAGPALASLKATSAQSGSQATAVGDVYVDLPCNAFIPGKANPSDFMSTGTFVMYTTDGFTYQYGYDPFAQSYKVGVSGLAVSPGILAQETVGIVATQLPAMITADNVDLVELWFVVEEHNLFPYERIGITGLEEGIAPSTSLNTITGQLLFEDARGYAGSTYFLDHLAVGAHAIDLGEEAVVDLREQVQAGWFGVGFAADGWDLGGSMNEVVFWTMFGGGSLQPELQPFFRIYYNAPPEVFALTAPPPGEVTTRSRPTFSWGATTDPNGDTPITYTLRLASDPQMSAPFELDAGPSTSITPPFPLAAGTYYWQVVARDPRGEERSSEQRSLQILSSSDSELLPMAFQHGAYPNPFNPQTTIHVSLTEAARIDLSIFDARGRRIRTLADAVTRNAGSHQFRWDGSDAAGHLVPTGTYFYVLNAGKQRVTRKLNLVK